MEKFLSALIFYNRQISLGSGDTRDSCSFLCIFLEWSEEYTSPLQDSYFFPKQLPQIDYMLIK